MLLHIEEIQMQKDIRNYDMKGVEFEQERADRRFLILEVSGTFASSMKTKRMWVRTESYKVVPADSSVQMQFLFNSWGRDTLFNIPDSAAPWTSATMRAIELPGWMFDNVGRIWSGSKPSSVLACEQAIRSALLPHPRAFGSLLAGYIRLFLVYYCCRVTMRRFIC